MNIAIAASCLVLIGAVWAAVVVEAQSQRAETIANAITHNSNLARVIEEHSIRTIKGVDAVALFIAHEYARLGAKVDLASYVQDGFIDGKLFINVSVADENGDLVANNQSLKAGNLADREHFKVHLARDSGRLHVGKPVLSRTTEKWSIQMTRRINKPDGSFGGIVSIAVDPTYFTDFYRQASLGESGLVMLIGLDGISRARRSGGSVSIGQDMSDSALLKEHLKRGIGSFLSTGKFENVPRYISYRTLPDYPLVVAVGTSQEEVLARFLQNRTQQYWAALLFTALIVAFAVLLIAALARRKRAVAALADSEARFRATFDQAAVGIVHTTLDRRFLMANQKFCDMVGYSRDELLTMNPIEITHPDDLGNETSYREQLLSGKLNTYADERRYVRKDGTVIWVNRTISLARDSAGKALHFIRVVDDISERKDAEGRFLATFEQAAVGIAHIDAHNFHILLANHKFCELLGYTQDELIGSDSRTRTPPGEMPERDAERAQLVAGTVKSSSCDRRLLRKDGSLLWVNRSLSLVRDPAGQPKYYISVIEDISERKQLQQTLLHLAQHDSLTGLPNRALFYDRLVHALEQARRRNWNTGVMFIDLDRFKVVNDTLGHGVGDQLLQQVSARLARCVRADDTLGRLGGDEFAVILSEVARDEDGSLVAEKIIDALARPFQIDGNEIFVTASIGITSCPPASTDADTLVRNADTAMYDAKQVGRNSYRFFSAATNQRAKEKRVLEGDLRQALARNQFVLHFQPKAQLGTGMITGMEALLRWQRPGGALVPPAEFIPLLEETGLIVPVGEWVLRTACAQISAWREAGLAPVPVAVNLSARQFHRHDICEMVIRALREYRVDPQFLELEITESAAMLNSEQTAGTLHKLKALGVRIAIDDFGTGYSSLAYLKRFPIDSLKIDRSFVTDLPGNEDDVSIAQAVITMAHALRLKVVAEGVENAAQLEFLAANGCDEMQGYFFSRPLAAPQCTEMLRQGRTLARPAASADKAKRTLLLVDAG